MTARRLLDHLRQVAALLPDGKGAILALQKKAGKALRDHVNAGKRHRR